MRWNENQVHLKACNNAPLPLILVMLRKQNQTQMRNSKRSPPKKEKERWLIYRQVCVGRQREIDTELHLHPWNVATRGIPGNEEKVEEARLANENSIKWWMDGRDRFGCFCLPTLLCFDKDCYLFRSFHHGVHGVTLHLNREHPGTVSLWFSSRWEGKHYLFRIAEKCDRWFNKNHLFL